MEKWKIVRGKTMTSKECLEHICKNCDNECCPYIHYDKSRCVFYGLIRQDLDRLEELEKFTKLCLTKYVPLDSLSPSFWGSKEEWLSTMSYDYYLFLCEEQCEYVVKENRRLSSYEFDLIYKLLKEELENE